jgi:hypothetical protein
MVPRILPIAFTVLAAAAVAQAQVDQGRAKTYFAEADELCAREGGRLWGVSLCGPMVFADAATRTIATNRQEPEAPRPAVLGMANAALRWGTERWSTFIWQHIPAERQARMRLFMHELFHRIQPELGLLLPDAPNDHLDTATARYWIRLEWRALAAALAASGAERRAAIGEALAFRSARRTAYPDAAERERVIEINEGLAQYTGTVVAAGSADVSARDAIAQLREVEGQPTFVRSFAYPSGAAYGVLLDAVDPGWPRRVRATDDLGRLLAAAANAVPAGDVGVAAARYDGPAIRREEDAREKARQSLLAELRQRFVDGPVLVLPPTRSAAFTNTGMTPIPGAGTIYPQYRTTAEWGTLEAAQALIPADRSRIILPAPSSSSGSTIAGEGYTLKIAPGWIVRSGSRPGDLMLVKAGS